MKISMFSFIETAGTIMLSASLLKILSSRHLLRKTSLRLQVLTELLLPGRSNHLSVRSELYMPSDPIAVFLYLFFAFVILIAFSMFVLSVYLLIRWIRAYFNKQGKPYRIRIGIAMLVISIVFLVFVCAELLPQLNWPFG